jgi:hypothetical protein
MTHDPTAPRMFPDDAANPTRAERAGTARYWHERQAALALTDDDPSTADRCAVCAGEHPTEQCPHGTAPTLTGDTRP